MSVIISAVSKKDGITFVGSNYMVEMKEKEDGTINYKSKKVSKVETYLEEKIGNILVVRGIFYFFKFKIIYYFDLILQNTPPKKIILCYNKTNRSIGKDGKKWFNKRK